jgi:hypothetical protein
MIFFLLHTIRASPLVPLYKLQRNRFRTYTGDAGGKIKIEAGWLPVVAPILKKVKFSKYNIIHINSRLIDSSSILDQYLYKLKNID